jgi:phospholipid/cholesterol/gamma-HCH transport system substrate-binding protein
MRRLIGVALTLAAGAAALLIILGSRADGASSARFDVIFDDARGLVSGQVIKIAGARAGQIENVVVTPDFKARVEGTIDSRFLPLRQDATCTIRPEGLIAENYVDCDPGTLGSPPLRAQGGRPPTVPVDRTTEPVSLLDLFNIFNLPTRQRFTAIVDELGIATAGRGDDLNAILRRANPALAEARKVIEILNRQHAALATAVDATSTIAAEGARHTGAVQHFLASAATLSRTTAGHSTALGQTVARLPGLLAIAQPTLAQLDTVARDGTPLAAQLHASVPALTRVQHDLGPLASAAIPALRDLRGALRVANPALVATTPLVRTLSAYAARSLPGTVLFAKLASNLQHAGFPESFFSTFYYIASSLSRYDATSHLLSILLIGPQNGACGNYATTPVAGCSAHFGQQPAYRPVRAAGDTSGHRSTRHAAPGPARRAARTVPPPAAPAAGNGAAGTPQNPINQTAQSLQGLVSYLLH